MDMKCIKTGCDVICDEIVFHGDLMYRNGVLVLSGVPEGSWQNIYPIRKRGEQIYYHFQCENLAKIPSTGHYACFLVENVFDVQQNFMEQIREYETPECIAMFEGK